MVMEGACGVPSQENVTEIRGK